MNKDDVSLVLSYAGCKGRLPPHVAALAQRLLNDQKKHVQTTIQIEDANGLRSEPFYSIEWLETGLIPLAEVERFGEWCRAQEREAIYDEWHSCVMSDLEHGVKCLNEKAAQDWHKNYPAQSKMFPEWLQARSEADKTKEGQP